MTWSEWKTKFGAFVARHGTRKSFAGSVGLGTQTVVAWCSQKSTKKPMEASWAKIQSVYPKAPTPPFTVATSDVRATQDALGDDSWGAQIGRYMDERGMTSSAVAERLGVNHTTVRKWWSGTMPTASTMARLLEAYPDAPRPKKAPSKGPPVKPRLDRGRASKRESGAKPAWVETPDLVVIGMRRTDVERPRKRSQCEGGPRPCPWVGCRYHLAIDVDSVGRIRETYPGRPLEELRDTCVLDVIDRSESGSVGPAMIARRLNLTKNSVIGIEAKAVGKISKAMDALYTQ